MATIERRVRQNDGKQRTVYRVKIRLKAGKAEATFNKLADAKKWASQTETAIREGRYFEQQQGLEHTVADAIAAYLLSPRFRRFDDKQKRESQLAWWNKRIGSRLIGQLTRADVAAGRDALLNDPNKSRSPATANRYLAALSAVMSYTVRELEWITRNPCSGVEREKEDNERTRYLSDVERDRLLAECAVSRSNDLYLLVLLALTTGARRQELQNLRWSDVDVEHGQVVFHDTKNGDVRTVPVRGEALGLLKTKKRAKVRAISSWVFPSPTRPGEHGEFRTAFDAAVKRADIEDFSFHGLRHTAASWMAMSGVPLHTIGVILGHKTASVTKRYAHLSPAHNAEAIEAMTGKFLAGNR